MSGSELLAVLSADGTLKYWQTAWGRYEKTTTSFTTYYYIRDHIGSTRVVLSETGQRVEAADYYAFGLKMPTRSLGANTKDWNTGKERDAETGWDYFGARYYNPSIGRWMNVDPMGDKFPSLSTYNYVFNNPVMVTDPDGMAPNDWVQIEGKMIYDSEVEDQGDATRLYGEGAIYRAPGYSYTSNEGTKVTLGDGAYYLSDGVQYSTFDYSRQTPPFPIFRNDSGSGGQCFMDGFCIGTTIAIAGAMPQGPIDIRRVGMGVTATLLAYLIYSLDRVGEISIDIPIARPTDRTEPGYEYFYRAMSFREFLRNGGFIFGKTDANGKDKGDGPFIASNLDYIISSKSFINDKRHQSKYDVLVVYKVPLGTTESLKAISIGATVPSSTDIARSSLIPVYKVEQSGNIMRSQNFGFPGYLNGSVNFNRRILGISVYPLR